MTRPLILLLVPMALIAAACGDDSSLEGIIDDLAAEQAQDDQASDDAAEPIDTSDIPPPDDPTGDDPTGDDSTGDDSTDPVENGGLAEDEQAIVDYLSGGTGVADADARCLVDGVAEAGIAEMNAEAWSSLDRIRALAAPDLPPRAEAVHDDHRALLAVSSMWSPT